MGSAMTSSHQIRIGPVAAASASERCAAIGSAGEWGRRGPTGLSRGADRRGVERIPRRSWRHAQILARLHVECLARGRTGAAVAVVGYAHGFGILSIGWPSGRVKDDFYREKPLQGVTDLGPLTCGDAEASAPRSARRRAMTSAWTKLRRPTARLGSTWAGTAAELDRQALIRG